MEWQLQELIVRQVMNWLCVPTVLDAVILGMTVTCLCAYDTDKTGERNFTHTVPKHQATCETGDSCF
eukprot:scaffold2462_cov127-Cylindrotheca_fusiformis.AAC.9